MLKSVNKVVKIMVFADLVLLFGWGLIVPILAIFIVENIQGGDAKVAGIAIGIYWLMKSIFQIPIAHYLDKNYGEKDDYYALIAGTLLAGFTPFGFIFASLPWHVYLLQIVHALGFALAVPSWSGIFTRHIEKGKEAFCWSLDSSALGIGTGLAGILGGIIAKNFGFIPLFITTSILAMITACLFFLIRKDLEPKEGAIIMPKPH